MNITVKSTQPGVQRMEEFMRSQNPYKLEPQFFFQLFEVNYSVVCKFYNFKIISTVGTWLSDILLSFKIL